jgi:hypothetical protein
MSVSEYFKMRFAGMAIAINIIILIRPSLKFIEWILWGSGPFLVIDL